MKYTTVVGSGAQHFGIESDVGVTLGKFKGGETQVQFHKSVRHNKLIILQSFANSPNDELMELLLLVDAARRAGAEDVNVVLPIFPYARQDRKADTGMPISARVVCDMLSCSNIKRLLTIDLHATQIQGFMSNKIVFDHIASTAFLAYHLKKEYATLNDLLICSPDAGGVKRAKDLGKLMGVDNFCMMHKVRSAASEIENMQLIGDVYGKKVLIVDDMIDTAGTIDAAVNLLYAQGATDVRVVATHGVLSSPAFDRLQGVTTYVTDSTAISEDRPDSIKVIKLKPLLTNIFRRMEQGSSIGELFTKWEE